MVRKDAGIEGDTVTGDTNAAEGPETTPTIPVPNIPEASPEIGSVPPAKRMGLVVVVAALLLLLVAGVAGAMLLVPGFRQTQIKTNAPVVSDATTKPRIEAAIGVMKALRINDIAAVRPYLVDGAQKAITDAQWLEAASLSEVASATYAPTVWSGDTTAAVDYTIDGGTGTMTFAENPTKPNVVTMTEVGIDGELVYDIEMTAVGTGWRALALTPRTEPFNLDTEFVKSLVETPTP